MPATLPATPPSEPQTEHAPPDVADPVIDEDLLIYISKQARIFAVGVIPKHSLKDVAQDIALESLIRMRAGEWDVAPDAIDSYVFWAVRLKSFDLIRRRQRRKAREQEHARELNEGTHAWVRPDTAGEDRELHDFYTRTLDSLTPACRRTYVMVRERGMRYQDVARELGISRSAVSANIVRAQHVFRQALLERGMIPPPAAKGGRYRKVDPITYEPRNTP
jgi:RNA polymerase sigma factor (sigma-70 family)